MISIQILIAVAVAVGVALTWTLAFMVAGVISRHDQARGAKAPYLGTIPANDPSQTADTRELVLR
jgi:hypothetical protein